MTKEDKRLYLLDAYALIYRAYFALSKNPIYNSKGLNTSAIYGFTNTLLDILKKEQPTHLAVVFDSPDGTDRAAEHDFYKANREAMPEDIATSIPIIKEILDGFKIPMLELSGYEADDIIGTLAKNAEKDGYTTYMVTPDKDFGQLVSENIYMYKPPYMGRPREILGVEEIRKKWDLERPEQVIDILGMMGDSVDNIPGIPGVGEKTAMKLVKQFGSMEGLYENTDQLKGKLKEKVEANKEQALISKQLATIITDAPVKTDEEDIVISDPDKDKLAALFAELEFRSIGKRVLGDDFSVNVDTSPIEGQMDLFSTNNNAQAENPIEHAEQSGKTLDNTEHDYQLADTKEKRKTLIDELAKLKAFCFDTETTGLDPNNCEIVGASFSWQTGKAWYVPFSEKEAEAKKELAEFKKVFEDKNIMKVGQNIKYDIEVLKWYDVEVNGPLFDTMVAHYLIDPESRHNMDAMAENYLGYTPVSIEKLIGKKGKKQGSMRDVPVEDIKEYAGEDADITWQLKERFEPEIKDASFEKLFYEVETPLVYVLAEMEHEGVAIDRDFLAEYSKELESDARSMQEKIHELAGTEFNIDSPKQMGQVLFEKMEIPYKGKKTKTGQYSTSEDTLTRLEGEHPIIDHILEYREVTKLKSTYVDALPALINERTGRIHSDFRQAVAATGRLSSQNPNLQNIPIRTERGRRVRGAFIPRDKDHVILSADYSQIELRLMAALSEDENMLEAFNSGKDIHATTASKVYDVPLEEVTRTQRSNAKAVNFGIIYGTTAYGLSQNLGISRGEASDIIKQYFEKYPRVKAYMESQKAFAKEHGYVETLMGRRRYLRDINSRNQTVRGHAERNAINAPLQGTAADMIKIAMVDLYKTFKKEGFRSAMTLQVHDELVFDAHKDELETIKPIIEKHMSEALEVNVPIVVEMGEGPNWLEAH